MSQPPDLNETLYRTFATDTAHIAVSDAVLEPRPNEPNHAIARVIGRGTCGTIYAASTSTVAYKMGRDRAGLWNDILLTARAHGAFVDTSALIRKPRIPAIKGWVKNTVIATFWKEHASAFAGLGVRVIKEDRRPALYVFALSLIPTVPLEARNALLSHFQFTTPKSVAFVDRGNDFCLVRPYLGLATRENQLLCSAENLWNFPLTLDDFKAFNLASSVLDLAIEMATGLAIIHWRAGIDGMEIEFVLGGADGFNDEQVKLLEIDEDDEPFRCASEHDIAPDTQSVTSTLGTASNEQRTRLYVLDFDKASLLSFDRPKAVIQRLVTAVTSNDPYFPDPTATNREHQEIWEVFRNAYLLAAKDASSDLVQKYGKQVRKWPTAFVNEWEKKAVELAEGRDGSFIEFV